MQVSAGLRLADLLLELLDDDHLALRESEFVRQAVRISEGVGEFVVLAKIGIRQGFVAEVADGTRAGLVTEFFEETYRIGSREPAFRGDRVGPVEGEPAME